MTWQFATALDIGDRNEQQDRVIILHSNSAHLLIVADGLGGHEDGAASAQTVIDIATRRFSQGVTDNPAVFLEKTCLEAHRTISALAEGSTSAPGSTCVMLYLVGNEAYWVHVGDSRMYQFHDSRLVYKTSDHSIAQLMKEHGNIALEGVEDTAPQNQLYMCLGGQNEVIPEFSSSEVRIGDLFLLCSDGLWSQISAQEMLANIGGEDWDTGKAEQLLALAKQRGQGQSDNISLAWAYWQGAADNKGSGLLGRLAEWFSH